MRAIHLVTVLFTLVSSTSAFARNTMILSKYEESGFVPPPMSRALECNIFPDHTEIAKRVAGVIFKTSRPTIVDTTAIYALIAEAKKAKLETNRGPVDGPTVIYNGYEILPTDGLETITLSELNGGTGYNKTNPSPEAAMLKTLIDEICQ